MVLEMVLLPKMSENPQKKLGGRKGRCMKNGVWGDCARFALLCCLKTKKRGVCQCIPQLANWERGGIAQEGFV